MEQLSTPQNVQNNHGPFFPQVSELPVYGEAFARQLGGFNQSRWNPGVPTEDFPFLLDEAHEIQKLECEWIEASRKRISPELANLPSNKDGIVDWFMELERSGPGQHDPLFDFLAQEANLEQMRYFIRQEVAGEAGFDDLVAMTQVKCPVVEAKLEMGNNYWDEIGRGNREAMHGPLLEDLAREMGVTHTPQREIVYESIELSNLLIALASHRRYTFLSIGALGSVELTAPSRAEKVAAGLKRLGLSQRSVRYYALHSTLDKKHWRDWRDHVLCPLLDENVSWGRFLAEGAFLRLEAGAKCFKRYRHELGLDQAALSRHNDNLQ